MKKKNDVLRKAFIEADVEYFERITKQTDIEWTPSDTFERKMNKLKQKHFRPYKTWTNSCRWVACFVLVFAIASSVVFNVEAVRSPIVDFFLRIYEKFTDVFIEDDKDEVFPNYIEVVYIPTLIPDEYQFDRQSENSTRITSIYTNKNNLQIRLTQQTLCQAHFAFDTENSQMYEITIGRSSGQYFINKGYIVISWKSQDYAFCLSVPDCFTVEEAVRIAESLAPLE